jgi:hypothetical protein
MMPPASDVRIPFRGRFFHRETDLLAIVASSSSMRSAAESLILMQAIHAREAAADEPCRVVRVPDLPGLYLATGFITTDEHSRLLRLLLCSSLEGRWTQLAKRHVLHYNRRFIYGANAVGPAGDPEVEPLPGWAERLQDRIAGGDVFTGLPLVSEDEDSDGTGSAVDTGSRGLVTLPSDWPVPPGMLFDQITVNKYHLFDAEISSRSKGKPLADDINPSEPGVAPVVGTRRLISSGIAPHCDAHTPFGDFILSLSLGSHTVMSFCRQSSSGGASPPLPIHLLLPPRSLLIMSAEARYAATHGIAERARDLVTDVLPAVPRSLRFSVTLRQARPPHAPQHLRAKCLCPALCDAPE